MKLSTESIMTAIVMTAKKNILNNIENIETPDDVIEMAENYLNQYSSRISFDIARAEDRDELAADIELMHIEAQALSLILGHYLEEIERQEELETEDHLNSILKK